MNRHVPAALLLALLTQAAAAQIQEMLFEPADPARSRTVPIKVYAPAHISAPLPVVLFSHGLGGSRAGSAFLGRNWAANGYAGVFLQHPGSDESVWKGRPAAEVRDALRGAIDPRQIVDRVRDVKFVLDRLQAWNASDDSGLRGRLDLEHVAMSGHSFGAITTQALMGQKASDRVDLNAADPRLDAFILMSPSQPRRGDAGAAFAAVAKPVLCMTGTEDDSPLQDHVTPASRRMVFAALPAGDKFQLVLNGATHFAFTDSNVRGGARDPRHHEAMLKITSAFLDAYLRADPEAKAWLQSAQARSALAPEDVWEWK